MQVIQLKKGEFNHCPFCGSDNLWVRIDRKGRSYVECSGCCAHGPIVNDILDAANDERAIGQIIDRWNTRKMRANA
jgi:NADH:ubiquinone oxidoreductase subunit E